MTSTFQPLKSINILLLAGIMASAALAATAQTVAPAAPAASATPTHSARHHGDHMSRHDPAQMQARRAKHQADLKAQLKLTPAQEGAWTAFNASMQPPAHGTRMTPEQHADINKLTTPERIDKMRALRSQHMVEITASMDKRGEAIKTFYAGLNADQKNVFDNQRMGKGGMNGMRGRGGMDHGPQHKG
jgi:protein CpxP